MTKHIKTKSNLINLRVLEDLRKKMQQKANAFTGGNLSEWLRLAAVKYTPEKEPKAS